MTRAASASVPNARSAGKIFLPRADAGGGAGAGGGAAGGGGGATEGAGPAAPIILVKSLCTGWAGITDAAGGRLILAPGIGVADADADGRGTTGGGPDHGLEGVGGGGGGAAGRGGGATTRSRADVALAPLIGAPEIGGAGGGGGMN